ncbi:hypothetical protein TTHERM_00189610 (macronuclear) [Tetrahymena thermophila SB210]|uniref:Uncharacterized protein n=1 Tax=Tetrahymena thermophila (strain SB210) TaxID=312017 RepID=I7M809_TETTS|nr:hypothetical protein TTHERM_00189610 [Tetrahymena thermophila SB210]EAR96392.1 hypothetical protein TTHERM_00189610 [Tetrahymena thermophila SB210]|eukprot:XP_001016637.1 hypothetical protein TTHERM_00189610 [Tetrahymena thermophila SB210]
MQDLNRIKNTQKIIQTVPLFIQKQLKRSHKRIYFRDSLNSKQLQVAIAKDFQGVEQGFLTEEKINKVYEGIIDMKYLQKEVILFFKNVIDTDFLVQMLAAYDINSLKIMMQNNNIDIIGIRLVKCE